MPLLNKDTYQGELEKNMPPLSVVKFLPFISEILNETFNQIKSRVISQDNEITSKIRLLQIQITIALTMYVFGRIDKFELLSSIHDFDDFISMKVDNRVAQKESKRIVSSLLGYAEHLISQYELIREVEEEIIPASLEKAIEEFFGKVTTESVKNMKAGESIVSGVIPVELGEVQLAAVKLPFSFGDIVTTGELTGKVVGYFAEELCTGIDEKSTMIIQVMNSRAEFEVFNFKSVDSQGILTKFELSSDQLYARVPILKARANYS